LSRWVSGVRYFTSNFRAIAAKPYSNLLIASDSAGWVLDEEAKEMIRLAGEIGFPAYFSHAPLRSLRQCVHYTSLFSLARTEVFQSRHRISVDYFHGKPDQDPAFRQVFEAMKKNAGRLHRVRLSYSQMLPLALEAGVPRERIHLIPIGINPKPFSWQTPESKQRMRARLGLPQSAVIVGSFQKDGQGWGDGMQPKSVKGPDVFVGAVARLKEKVPEIFVLLTGPARGFVKAGLEKAGIPYKHFYFDDYSEIGAFYQALDLYIVASREEGGPKSILESMISGVPLVTTKVGQAIDLVTHGENALFADIEDEEGLASEAARLLGDSDLRARLLKAGRETAANETYDAQLPRWRKLFTDYLEGSW
jgi:glycosyltransferase involved in cell wall biosynthesis